MANRVPARPGTGHRETVIAGYQDIRNRLKNGGLVILDGGTGTELERRGVEMNEKAWCGPATAGSAATLEEIHRDYIDAGADIITTNTFASSRLMLAQAGLAAHFEDINRAAVRAAMRARDQSRKDCLVAGSLSHMSPVVAGSATTDRSRLVSRDEMAQAFGELAELLKEEGCDFILLEMMYDPERMAPAFEAAAASGLPVWAGFSVRRGTDNGILSFSQDRDIPFSEIIPILDQFEIEAAGVMHSPSNVVAEAIEILRARYPGPLMAYPDSGYFKMPHWQFENIIPPPELQRFATRWIEDGIQIIGGCCGLSPEHIAAVSPLKASVHPSSEP